MSEFAGQAPILLVDDDAIDTEMVRRCLKSANIQNGFYTALDGVDAWEMLTRDNLIDPCLILLDINMPHMNGLEFLDRLRANPALRHHIVFILTTSLREEDKAHAYNYNVAGYILKKNIHDLGTVLNHYCHINEFPN